MTTRTLRRRRAASAATATTFLLSLAAVANTSPTAVHAGPPPVPCVQNVCLIVVEPVADSDGDGFTDADEKAYGSDPGDPQSHPPVLRVIDGVFSGTTPSFTDHTTELVVLPVLQDNRTTVLTGLGNFSLPGTSKEERAGLTLHQQYGLDVDLGGLHLDVGQSLITRTSNTPKFGDRWSMYASGGGKSNVTQTVVGKEGSAAGTFTSTKDGRTTTTAFTGHVEADGSRTVTKTSQSGTIQTDGSVQSDGNTTTTTTTQSPADQGGTFVTKTTSVTTDTSGKTLRYSEVATTTYGDGTKGSDVTIVTYTAQGRIEVVGNAQQDAEGNITSATWTTTVYDANGAVVSETPDSCKGDECGFSDPDLEQAMGWAGPLTSADWQRVGVRLGSTIHTVEGFDPPAIGDTVVTTSPHGPLVALIDPEIAVTVIAAGAPRFTSAQPEYDPMLNEITGAVRDSGQLPAGTSPYQHDQP